jgi:hypothetical protein
MCTLLGMLLGRSERLRQQIEPVEGMSFHLKLNQIARLLVYHLNLCDVLLPPDGFLQFRFESGEEEVGVHNCMHETVDYAEE